MASMVLPFIANFKAHAGFDITIPEPIDSKIAGMIVGQRKTELRILHTKLSSNLREAMGNIPIYDFLQAFSNVESIMDSCAICGTSEGVLDSCDYCDEGEMECGYCVGGQVECPDCGGEGEFDCENCNGTGEVSEYCEPCDATGEITVDCEGCDNAIGGVGYVQCEVCDGTGEDDDGKQCKTCEGEMQVKCEVCGGKGEELKPCEDCDGRGQLEVGCGECAEIGMISCDYCVGAGEFDCEDCDGWGRNECAECEGLYLEQVCDRHKLTKEILNPQPQLKKLDDYLNYKHRSRIGSISEYTNIKYTPLLFPNLKKAQEYISNSNHFCYLLDFSPSGSFQGGRNLGSIYEFSLLSNLYNADESSSEYLKSISNLGRFQFIHHPDLLPIIKHNKFDVNFQLIAMLTHNWSIYDMPFSVHSEQPILVLKTNILFGGSSFMNWNTAYPWIA